MISNAMQYQGTIHTHIDSYIYFFLQNYCILKELNTIILILHRISIKLLCSKGSLDNKLEETQGRLDTCILSIVQDVITTRNMALYR